TIGLNISDFSASVEGTLIEPVDPADCPTEPIDLGVAVRKNSQRHFLTLEQFANAGLDDAQIEGLSITSATGNFIISPALLNSTEISRDDALYYYFDLLPTREQAVTISARYQDINSALKNLGWTPFVTDKSDYFYLTKTSDYALNLYLHSGGGLARSNTGYIRGVCAINEDEPIDWHAPEDMTPYAGGLRIAIGDLDFVIKLHDEQSGSVIKDAAIALYADRLPSKNQADIIAMRYADINRALQAMGGEPFHNGDYMTRSATDSIRNYAINFSDFRNAVVEPSTEGFIRGVIDLTDPVDSLVSFSAYDITHSITAADDDDLGKIQMADNPKNNDEIVYLERDGVFIGRSADGKWNRRWNGFPAYGEHDSGGVRPEAGRRFICSQTGVKFTADSLGHLVADNATQETLTVTTWNLGGFNKGNSGTFVTSDSIRYEAILTEFRQVIDSIKPDLMGCTEFLANIYADRQIRDDLFSEFPYAEIPEISIHYQGKAFFSKYPLFNAHAFKVGQSIAMEADALIGNQIFKLCLIHPTWWRTEIDNNWQELTELARRYKYVDRVILMGDCNVLKEREAESWQLFADSGFTLGNFGVFGSLPTTYNSVICSMTLDNIMVKGAEILGVSTVQFTPEGLDPAMPNPADELLWDAVNPSDHFPFTAIIRTGSTASRQCVRK
ncbi:MAG: hypothetical protein K2K82_02055, partial [Muribaculaceae bacterium]|nr:hypothetical protein [Muribaculaceae bacterium]